MTTTQTTGPVPPLPALEAAPDILATARENCAARLRARGWSGAADAIADGLQDGCWAMRHEVRRLEAERAARVEHVPV